MTAAFAGCRKTLVGTGLAISLLLTQMGTDKAPLFILVSHVAIQCFGLTGVIIIFCFIFSQQVKELQNYILKVELGSSSSRNGRSSTIGSSSRMSSQSSSTSIGRKRHFSDLEVSSYRTLVIFVSNILCVYVIYSNYFLLSKDTLSMFWSTYTCIDILVALCSSILCFMLSHAQIMTKK